MLLRSQPARPSHPAAGQLQLDKVGPCGRAVRSHRGHARPWTPPRRGNPCFLGNPVGRFHKRWRDICIDPQEGKPERPADRLARRSVIPVLIWRSRVIEPALPQAGARRWASPQSAAGRQRRQCYGAGRPRPAGRGRGSAAPRGCPSGPTSTTGGCRATAALASICSITCTPLPGCARRTAEAARGRRRPPCRRTCSWREPTGRLRSPQAPPQNGRPWR